MKSLDDYATEIGETMAKSMQRMMSKLTLHKELGLTGPQFRLLIFLEKRAQANIKQLAEWFDVKPSAMTMMVDRLVQGGFVLREEDPQDRRSVVITLSPMGQDVTVEAKRRSTAILKTYLAKLTADELETIVSVFDKWAEDKGDCNL